MSIFLHILSHNIFPVFILISLGFILNKKFNLHVLSLSKVLFYLCVPAFIFVHLYTASLRLDMIKVVICALLMIFSHDLLGRIIARLRGYDADFTNAFKNSIMFNNCGNIGVSLITLIFSSYPFVLSGETPYLGEAVAAQIMILMIQNVTSNTLGFFNAGQAKLGNKLAFRRVLTMPSLYAIPLALIMKEISFDLAATPLWPALTYLKDGLVPIALLTLGVQLSKTKFNFTSTDIHLSVFIKLLVSPLIAFIFIEVFGFTGVIAQTVFIAHSVPTAVNTALIAVECDSQQDFASQAVMMSTLFSAITLTLAIYTARVLFPV